jgi:ABC-type Fe3+-siderophore transport system permease subunit
VNSDRRERRAAITLRLTHAEQLQSFDLIPLLANAPRWDATQQNMLLVLTCLGGIAVAAVMAGLIAVLARRRKHPNAHPLIGVAIGWAIVATASVAYAAVTQLSWQKSHALELQSGYGDWRETAPSYPRPLWLILLAVYAALLLWAFVGAPSRPLDREP